MLRTLQPKAKGSEIRVQEKAKPTRIDNQLRILGSMRINVAKPQVQAKPECHKVTLAPISNTLYWRQVGLTDHTIDMVRKGKLNISDVVYLNMQGNLSKTHLHDLEGIKDTFFHLQSLVEPDRAVIRRVYDLYDIRHPKSHYGFNLGICRKAVQFCKAVNQTEGYLQELIEFCANSDYRVPSSKKRQLFSLCKLLRGDGDRNRPISSVLAYGIRRHCLRRSNNTVMAQRANGVLEGEALQRSSPHSFGMRLPKS
jgi:hypothetical protein